MRGRPVLATPPPKTATKAPQPSSSSVTDDSKSRDDIQDVAAKLVKLEGMYHEIEQQQAKWATDKFINDDIIKQLQNTIDRLTAEQAKIDLAKKELVSKNDRDGIEFTGLLQTVDHLTVDHKRNENELSLRIEQIEKEFHGTVNKMKDDHAVDMRHLRDMVTQDLTSTTPNEDYTLNGLRNNTDRLREASFVRYADSPVQDDIIQNQKSTIKCVRAELDFVENNTATFVATLAHKNKVIHDYLDTNQILNETIDILKETVDECEVEIISVRRTLKAREDEIGVLQGRLEEAETKHHSEQQQVQHLAHDNKDITQKLDNLKTANEMLAQELKDSKTTIAFIEDKNTKNEWVLAGLKEEMERKLADVEKANEKRLSDVKKENAKKLAELRTKKENAKILTDLSKENEKKLADVRKESEKKLVDLKEEYETKMRTMRKGYGNVIAKLLKKDNAALMKGKLDHQVNQQTCRNTYWCEDCQFNFYENPICPGCLANCDQ